MSTTSFPTPLSLILSPKNRPLYPNVFYNFVHVHPQPVYLNKLRDNPKVIVNLLQVVSRRSCGRCCKGKCKTFSPASDPTLSLIQDCSFYIWSIFPSSITTDGDLDKSPLEEYLHELYNEKQECDLKTVEPVPLRTSWWLPLSPLRVVHHHFSHYGHMIKVVPFFM